MDGAVHRCAGRRKNAGDAEGFVVMIDEADRANAVGENDLLPHLIAKLARHIRAKHGVEDVGEWRSISEAESAIVAGAVALEVLRRGADHPIAAMAVAKGNRHRPGDVVARGDVLVAFPRDVVGRVANAEDGIEQEIHGARSRADNQVGAGNCAFKPRSCALADFLHADKERHADRDRQNGQRGAEAAAEEALGGERDDGRAVGHADLNRSGGVDGPQVHIAIEMARQRPVMADEQQAGAVGGAFLDQQRQKRVAGVRVECGSRFVGDDQFGSCQSSARAAATRCCWPTLSAVTELARWAAWARPRWFQQSVRFVRDRAGGPVPRVGDAPWRSDKAA